MNAKDLIALIAQIDNANLSFEGEIYINNPQEYVSFNCLHSTGDVFNITVCTKQWLQGIENLICTIRDFEGTVVTKARLGSLSNFL